MNRIGSNTIGHNGDVRRTELGADWNHKLRVMDDRAGIHTKSRMIAGTTIENVAAGHVAQTDDRISCSHRRIISVGDRLGEAVNLTSIQRICVATDQGGWNAGNVGLPHRLWGTVRSVRLDVR